MLQVVFSPKKCSQLMSAVLSTFKLVMQQTLCKSQQTLFDSHLAALMCQQYIS